MGALLRVHALLRRDSVDPSPLAPWKPVEPRLVPDSDRRILKRSPQTKRNSGIIASKRVSADQPVGFAGPAHEWCNDHSIERSTRMTVTGDLDDFDPG